MSETPETPKPADQDGEDAGGIPADANKGEAKGLPHSDREQTEKAGKPDA